jgi:hypothetical protein
MALSGDPASLADSLSSTPSEVSSMKLLFLFVLSVLVRSLQASPLFDESLNELLTIEIETDLYKIKNEKSDYHSTTENFVNGQLRHKNKRFNARIQTSGHSRLAGCEFPPLRLRLKESEIQNSLFEGNQNVRIVTHCHEDKLQLLFREHLIYKMYSLITPYSFRVRLFKVKYLDSEHREKPITSFAFFVESDRSVEKRLKLAELKSDSTFNLKTYADIAEQWLNAPQVKLQEAFQHLIRNYDWVIFFSNPAETMSLANIKVFYDEKEGFPFPHDFDLAGVVTWNADSFEERYDEENRCQEAGMRKALTAILGHIDEFIQLVDEDPYLDSGYKEQFAGHLGRFKSVEDFC